MSINKIYHDFKTIYHKYNLNIIASIIGNLLMAILNLILIINGGSLFLLGAILFYLFMSILRGTSFIFYKKDKSIRKIGFVYAISSTFIYLLIPSLLAYVLSEKEYQPFFIDWFIYAYATYGTIKMVFAIKNLCKKEKTNRQYVLSFFFFFFALYTIQMMEFSLIKTFSESGNDGSMYLMQLFTQGAIFIVSLIIIVLFIIRLIKQKPAEDSNNL